MIANEVLVAKKLDFVRKSRVPRCTRIRTIVQPPECWNASQTTRTAWPRS